MGTAITASKNTIYQEALDYKSGVSEAALTNLGASINWLLTNAAGQVGDVVTSPLTEVQFQTQRDNTWVLCDGDSCAGSDYATLTGNSTVPDLRGEFIRGLDNGRNVDVGRSMLSSQTSQSEDHTHEWYRGGAGYTGQTYLSDGTTGYTEQQVSNISDPEGIITAIDQTGGGSFVGNVDNWYSFGGNNDTSTVLYTKTQTDLNTGDARPRNVALNFFIKINE